MKSSWKQQTFFWVWLLLCGSVAVSLSLQATALFGPGLSPDSVDYIKLAEDISDSGLGFLREAKAISQPPLYSVVLASVAVATGCDLLVAARVVSCVSLLVVVVLTMMAVKVLESPFSVVLFVGALASFSVPLLQISFMAWTETLFIGVICSTFAVLSYGRSSFLNSLALVTLVGLACLIRYAGIVLIPCVLSHLLLFAEGEKKRRRWLAACFLATSSTIFGLYVLRNYSVSGYFLGPRAPSSSGWMRNVYLVARVLKDWFDPNQALGLGVAAGASLVILAAWSLLCRLNIARELRRTGRHVLIHGIFIILYVLFILWTSAVVAYDHVDSRLLSPVYPSLLVLLAFLLQPRVLGGRARSTVVVCLLSLLMIPVFVHSVRDAFLKSSRGAGGYSTREWQDSELIGYLKESRGFGDSVLFSNDPGALYLLAGLNAKMSPAKFHYKSDERTGIGADNLFSSVPDFDGAVLVWFDNSQKGFLFGLRELEAMSSVHRMREFDDGAVYRIER